MFLFFFFKQKTAYEMRISDWSSDVCSSDLVARSLIEQGRTLMTMSQMALMNATRGSKRIPSAARAVMLAIAGSALIAVCARIQVPMWPVPMTMQTFAVLPIGLAYGSRLGAATVAQIGRAHV